MATNKQFRVVSSLEKSEFCSKVREILNTKKVGKIREFLDYSFGCGKFICPYQVIENADFFFLTRSILLTINY